jgi:8-oxo-dGTP pyrophosphatase MutT (NUDIX family)
VSSTASSRAAAKPLPGKRQPGSIRQQVAAVCYRRTANEIEFLLVRTRGGRWIFPKGGVEEGLTQAQSAAMEAFEEAGVHGRIEEMPFARYRLARSSDQKSSGRKKSSARNNIKKNKVGRSSDPERLSEETVTAHLCQVSHLDAPQEPYRTPTWFSAEKAKRRLNADRHRDFGDELAGVVDRAVSRIRRLEASTGSEFANDALRKVRFEASENGPVSMPMQKRGSTSALARRLLLEARRIVAKPALEADSPSSLRRHKTNYVQ